jgi:excisionase family DNA binding protein
MDHLHLPMFMTPTEAATLLRTSRKAVYAMIARHAIPGVIYVGRRVLFRTSDLLDWLGQKSAPSLKE